MKAGKTGNNEKEKKTENGPSEKRSVLWIILLWFIVLGIWVFGWFFGFSVGIRWWWRLLNFFVGLPILFYLGILVIWHMAKYDILFTFVETGWAKAITEGGQFVKVIMSWPDYHLNNKWEVVEDVQTPISPNSPVSASEKKEIKGWHRRIFSRIFYVGIFFRQLYKYHWSWSHMHDDGTVVMHDEDLNKVKLTREPFAFKFQIGKESPEDINGNRVELTFVMPGRIVGIYGVLFKNPKWFATMRALVHEVLKNFVGQYRAKEDLFNMIAGEGIGDLHKTNNIFKLDKEGKPMVGTSRTKPGDDIREYLWEEFKNTIRKKGYLDDDSNPNEIRVFDVIIERGINIVDVALDPEAQEYITKKWQAQKQAEVITITAEAEADAVAEAIGGSIVKSYAKMTGRGDEEVRQGIPLDAITPVKMLEETRKRQAIKEGRYFEIEHPPTQEGTLLGLIGGYKQMPTGGGSGSDSSRRGVSSNSGSSSLNEQKKSGRKDKPARKIKTIEEADAYFQQLEEGRTEEEEEEEEEV